MSNLARPPACLSMLLQDLRYGARTLRQNPGFASVAVLSLALGIGANTAIFQLIDTVRLRTLPVSDPQGLVTIGFASTNGQRGSHVTNYPALTNPQWERLRGAQDAFSGMLAWWANNFGLNPAGGEQRLARGLFVSGDFFRVLGVPALRGRVFTAADDRRGCGLPGAVISYAFWQREFGGEPSAIGRKLTLNYNPVEIIGVTPAGFSGLEIGSAFDVAVPICSQSALWTEGSWLDSGTTWWLTVMGRFQPGWTLERANARLQVLSPGLFRATLPANYPPVSVPDYLKMRLVAAPAATGVSMLREDYNDPLLLLLVTAGLVLLIACANLANLMLARAAAREHEIAVRLAIGASRSRLVRQLMAESLLLAGGGAALGLALADFLSRVLVAMLATRDNPLSLDLAPDRAVLAFTIGLATLTCLLFGLVPAWRATRVGAAEAMRAKGRGTVGGRERFGLRQALVVAQVALSLMLLVGALLFSGSLRNLLKVDAGFRQNGVLVTYVDFRRLPIPKERRTAFKVDLLARLRVLPGVGAAGQVGSLPLSGSSTSNTVWQDGSDGRGKFVANFAWISNGYLKTMGMPLLAGRDFEGRENPASPRLAIVNETFARKMGLGGNPVGKHFRRESTPSEPETSFEVIGLVRDTKYYSLRDKPMPIVFCSIDQDADRDPSAGFVLYSTAPLADTIERTRAAILQTSPEITMDFRSFAGLVAEGLVSDRLMATLSGFFGMLACLIAAMGLYGVMSYLVARRANEIGIRMALGADRRRILALVLRQSAALLAVGLAAGALASLAAARAVASLLFGLQPHDAGVLTLAILLLAGITLAASYLPARRASRLEPVAALREE